MPNAFMVHMVHSVDFKFLETSLSLEYWKTLSRRYYKQIFRIWINSNLNLIIIHQKMYDNRVSQNKIIAFDILSALNYLIIFWVDSSMTPLMPNAFMVHMVHPAGLKFLKASLSLEYLKNLSRRYYKPFFWIWISFNLNLIYIQNCMAIGCVKIQIFSLRIYQLFTIWSFL